MSKYLTEAAIPGASTHALRHTFTTHHVRKGTKLDIVRQALGHESLATTSVYVGLAREVMDQELQRNTLYARAANPFGLAVESQPRHPLICRRRWRGAERVRAALKAEVMRFAPHF